MKAMKVLGIVLIVAGGVALAYKGFSYQKKETLLQLGDAKVQIPVRKRVNIPTWAGFALLGGGVLLLVMGPKK